MATGRIGVTPTLGTRWSKAPAGGTTSLSGLDDNSVSLVYSVGYEQVYRNGVLLSRTNDYTATTGNSITLIDATIAGDIIEVFANELVPLTDAISKGQFTAKGALLSATAASTPAVLTVGSNDQVLTADSTTSTGLKWAAIPAASENFTLLNAGGTALTGAQTITVSGISAKGTIYVIFESASSANATSTIQVRINGDTGSNYSFYGILNNPSTSTWATTYMGRAANQTTGISIGRTGSNAADTVSGGVMIRGCNSSGQKMLTVTGGALGENNQQYATMGWYNSSSTVSSVSLFSSTGNFDAGTMWVYASA